MHLLCDALEFLFRADELSRSAGRAANLVGEVEGTGTATTYIVVREVAATKATRTRSPLSQPISTEGARGLLHGGKGELCARNRVQQHVIVLACGNSVRMRSTRFSLS